MANREYIASCVCVSGFVPSWLCVSVLSSSVWVVSRVCVVLFYYTDIGESLRSRGQFLTAVDVPDLVYAISVF